MEIGYISMNNQPSSQ